MCHSQDLMLGRTVLLGPLAAGAQVTVGPSSYFWGQGDVPNYTCTVRRPGVKKGGAPGRKKS